MTPNEEVKQLRKQLGWTIVQAAGVFRFTLAHWRTIERNPKLPNESIIHFLKMKLEERDRIYEPAPHFDAEDLKTFRSAYNLTQSSAAALVDVSQQSWARWESGKRRTPQHISNKLMAFVEQHDTPQK